MDEMIGGDFEKGLTLLKNIVEKKYTAIREVEVKQAIFPAKNYAAVRGEVSFEEMPAFYEASFATLMQEVQKGRVRVVGAPAGLYFSWDEQQMRTDMAAAVPIRGNLSGGEIEMIHVPAQTAFLVDHYGSYENLGNSHEALDYYLAKQGLAMKSPVIEEYITDPTSEPDTSKWLTKIYYLYE
jgi:effector-binding domain-containing protein